MQVRLEVYELEDMKNSDESEQKPLITRNSSVGNQILFRETTYTKLVDLSVE